MKKVLGALLLVAIFVTGLIIVSSSPETPYRGEFIADSDSNVAVNLALANTTEQRKKGLMNTFWMSKRDGMLFVFEDDAERSFWMKNTYIPLDIIFLDEDFRIINIEEAETQPLTSENNLKNYRSEGPAMYVIELKRGFTSGKNISSGDYFIPGEKLSSCCV